MYLSSEEERMLQGEYGEEVSLAMNLIVKLGDFYNAEKTVNITSSQISGISYKNIGDFGIDFLKKFENTKVKVKTFINPIGFDLEHPEYFTDDKDFIEKQKEIIEIYKKIGVTPTLTCTPYYIYRPSWGEHIAWAESSAIVFANSLLGARTNRESGISALASAITGRVAFYGMHTDEGRKPTLKIKFEFKPEFSDYSTMGLYIGKTVANGIPYFLDLDNDQDYLKILGAAMNATGSIPMFHAENITPEWKNYDTKDLEKISIEKKDIQDFREKINCKKDVDVVFLGCPHLSDKELIEIAKLLRNRKVKSGKKLMLFTSRAVKNSNIDTVREIEKSGANVFSDTCMVVSPIYKDFTVIGLNSGKATFYLGKERKTVLMDLKNLLEMVLE